MRVMRILPLILLALVCTGIACAEAPVATLEQLNAPDRIIGVSQGSISERTVAMELPLAKLAHYTDKFLGYADVASGKIDAFVYDLRQMQLAIQNGQKGVRLLDETMKETTKIVVGISSVSPIPNLNDKINDFIAELRTDGTLDDMFTRWVVDENEDMPMIALPQEPAFHLRVGTSGIVPPYSYYRGTKLNGYDIELAYRFAAWLNADLEFGVYDYAGIIPAAQSGKIDCIMANLQFSAERQESFLFSDPLFEEKQGVMVRDTGEAHSAPVEGTAPKLDQFSHARIGVQTGSSYAQTVQACLPDASLSYYNSYTDLIAALEGDKIDAFPASEDVVRSIASGNDRIAWLPEYLMNYDCGFAFAKTKAGEALCAQFNAFLHNIKADGTLKQLEDAWFVDDAPASMIADYTAFPATNGTLHMATEAAYPPFEYISNNRFAGLDIDIAVRFCKACGYGLIIEDMNFDGVLSSVQSGKCDFAGAGLAITPERAQSVLFSDPNYTGGVVLAFLRSKSAALGTDSDAAPSESASLWDGIKDSFIKTFVREDRWKLFARGVVTTLIITLLAILFGTALGFGTYMLCRNGNRLANAFTRAFNWLVQGTPMVVLLMVLYYIVFGRAAISGIVVAVAGFTLTFGASVYGMLCLGVGTVDIGQFEAARALGYSNRRAFFRFILPQALPHVMPAYKLEIVSLIKSTAIVGYIAVQDLTKMGDIVRSRTYQAFFPLIAVAIIYFLLEGLLRLAVSRIQVNIDPRRRGRDAILKGVKTDD